MKDLFGHDRVEDAIALLKLHEPEQGYYGCFSGGKDSCVIKELARLAGVRVTWHYNQTTIDPPEVVRFLREFHSDVQWVRAPQGFFVAMVRRGFPTRRGRWCCQEYKEDRAPAGAVLLFGVRAAESPRRAATWKPVTWHTKTKAWCVSPILHWSDADVWAFIRSRRLAYCSLYDEGFDRLGCIGCPMTGRAAKEKEFARWPKFERAWQAAFQRVWEDRRGRLVKDGKGGLRPWFGERHFHEWREMWNWWMGGRGTPAALDDEEDGSCQIALDMFSQPEDESETTV